MSSITAYGESAFLKPGHAPQIGKGTSGTIYIDDFEGSTSSIDLRFPLTSWALASVPQGNGLFQESALNDVLTTGVNRAKIAWYNIDPTLQDNSNSGNPVTGYQNFNDPRITAIYSNQLFPNITTQIGLAQLVTFDVAYYPTDKGPYISMRRQFRYFCRCCQYRKVEQPQNALGRHHAVYRPDGF